jgi:hypothetical protein
MLLLHPREVAADETPPPDICKVSQVSQRPLGCTETSISVS